MVLASASTTVSSSSTRAVISECIIVTSPITFSMRSKCLRVSSSSLILLEISVSISPALRRELSASNKAGAPRPESPGVLDVGVAWLSESLGGKESTMQSGRRSARRSCSSSPSIFVFACRSFDTPLPGTGQLAALQVGPCVIFANQPKCTFFACKLLTSELYNVKCCATCSKKLRKLLLKN